MREPQYLLHLMVQHQPWSPNGKNAQVATAECGLRPCVMCVLSGEWYCLVFSVQAYAVLPLLPLSFPIIWVFLNLYGVARIQAVFDSLKDGAKVCFPGGRMTRIRAREQFQSLCFFPWTCLGSLRAHHWRTCCFYSGTICWAIPRLFQELRTCCKSWGILRCALSVCIFLFEFNLQRFHLISVRANPTYTKSEQYSL